MIGKKDNMNHILFTGDWKSRVDFITILTSAGFMVSVLPDSDVVSTPCDLIITIAAHPDDLKPMKEIGVPWLVCCTGNNTELLNSAYQYGAMAVFPEGTTDQVIIQFIQRSLMNANPSTRKDVLNGAIAQRRYQKGDIIVLEPDTALEIQKGILSQNMVYQDGSEVLLGLFGTGQMVIPHPSDTCYIQLIAHTDLLATIKSWEQVSHDPNFLEKFRSRLQQLEAWAAMQARPHLDQRVLGILSLLSEQFGRTTPEGQIVDVRITHTQLATAVGATRATITRTLGDLRHQNKLSIINTADGERFCLLQWEPGHHGPHSEGC